jgi:hypothetical protein
MERRPRDLATRLNHDPVGVAEAIELLARSHRMVDGPVAPIRPIGSLSVGVITRSRRCVGHSKPKGRK